MMARKSFLKREKVERSKNKITKENGYEYFYFVATTPEEVIDLLDGKLDGKTV